MFAERLWIIVNKCLFLIFEVLFNSDMKSSTGNIGSVLAIMLFMAGVALFGWNEYRTARLATLIKKAGKECVELDQATGEDLEGKLVHAVGKTRCTEPLKDPDLGVEVDAMVLKRSVSYFQLAEYHDNLTDDITYYEDWCDTPLSSKDYIAKHRDRNFTYVRLESRKDTCRSVMLGQYGLQKDLVGWMRGYSPELEISLPQAALEQLAAKAQAAAPERNRPKVRVLGNRVYIGENPNKPQVGDVLIEYEAIPHETVSVLAKIENGNFVKYGAEKEYFIYQIVPGSLDAESMLSQEKKDNRQLGWVLRGIALILLVISGPATYNAVTRLFTS